MLLETPFSASVEVVFGSQSWRKEKPSCVRWRFFQLFEAAVWELEAGTEAQRLQRGVLRLLGCEDEALQVCHLPKSERSSRSLPLASCGPLGFEAGRSLSQPDPETLPGSNRLHPKRCHLRWTRIADQWHWVISCPGATWLETRGTSLRYK